MKYTQVYNMELCRIVLGVGLYGTMFTPGEGEAFIRAYMECGGNVFDTGNVYANWIEGFPRSASEKFLGVFFKENPGLREKIILCTKGAHYDFADPERKPRVKPECIRHDLEDSRKNMGVDFIDIYWLHRDDVSFPVEPIMDALFEAQDSKKIGCFGASNWTTSRIREANAYAAKCGRDGFFGSQIQHSYIHTLDVKDKTTLFFNEERDSRFYTESGLDVFAYTSQAKGYVTKVVEGRELPELTAKNYDCPTNRERAARAQSVAGEIGSRAEEVALAYMHYLPYNTLTIIGPRSPEQLRASMRAGDVTLAPEQLAFLGRDETPLPR